MKDRLITFGLAVAAFALFYALLAPKPAAPMERPTRPVSIEKGPNGYLGLMRWLQDQGVETVSLRERYGRLHEISGADAPVGNILISTAPHLQPPRASEIGPLREWIADGNTLLVVAGLSDTPEWSMGEGIDSDFMDHMKSMTGLSFITMPERGTGQGDDRGEDRREGDAAQPKPESKSTPAQRRKERIAAARAAMLATQKLDEPLQFEMAPNGPHPLLAGVQSVRALSEYPSSQWRAVSDEADLLLELAQNRKSGEPVLWLRLFGRGQIIFSAYGSILTNKLLGEQDNARLLANIVAWTRASGGKVIIDDTHQGLVAFYDAQAFFGDRRLHASLWWLVALWLVFVLGPQRLRPAGARWNPVDITGFVRASGGFLARVLRPAVAAERMFENFFNGIRRTLGLPANGAPVWEWLEVRSAASDVERLRQLYEDMLRQRRIDLSKLQNLLVRMRAGLI